MKKCPNIFVIILNYNGGEVLMDCLRSVFQSDYPNFETVVVDNDSDDGSFEKARQNFSRAHFIKNSSNLGFSKGNNLGIRFALEKFADYVFILNNDAIIEKTTLSKLEEELSENQSAGIASPVIMDGTGNKVWFAGGAIDWKKMRTTHSFDIKSSDPYLTEYISGCAMLVKAEVFKKIGLFDERYFLYYEDADFSLRAVKAGCGLVVDPSVRIRHFEKSTENKEKTYWLVLSALIFFHTHESSLRKIRLFFYLGLRKTKNLFDVIFSRNPLAPEVRRAYRDFKKIEN